MVLAAGHGNVTAAKIGEECFAMKVRPRYLNAVSFYQIPFYTTILKKLVACVSRIELTHTGEWDSILFLQIFIKNMDSYKSIVVEDNLC